MSLVVTPDRTWRVLCQSTALTMSTAAGPPLTSPSKISPEVSLGPYICILILIFISIPIFRRSLSPGFFRRSVQTLICRHPRPPCPLSTGTPTSMASERLRWLRPMTSSKPVTLRRRPRYCRTFLNLNKSQICKHVIIIITVSYTHLTLPTNREV